MSKKSVLVFILLLSCAGLSQASIIETISFDLSNLNPGSTLSGTFTLSDSPSAGDTAIANLTFSDPANYSPTSVTTTISLLNGTPSGWSFSFSQISFTNLNGTSGPINTRDVFLNRLGYAHCASLPCTTTGAFTDRDPAVFTASYSISPAGVPEPGYAVLLPLLLAGLAAGRRFAARTARS